MYTVCRNLGFELFQGYYFSRPELVMTREVSVGFANMAHLLNILGNVEASDADVENGFRIDPALTYKLLRIVNSAAIGGRGIESIPFAIRMLGRQMLYRWLALLMVSSMVGGTALSDQLVYTSLLRARMCELVADASLRLRGSQALFLTGLFSMLDVLLRMPMTEVFKRVHVASEIRDAVVDGTGLYADVLQLTVAYQRGDWDAVDRYANALGLLPVQIPWLYTKSLSWVSEQLVLAQDAAA
jgi:EAL and modified HD-GYP domain-containing signal transduction protein